MRGGQRSELGAFVQLGDETVRRFQVLNLDLPVVDGGQRIRDIRLEPRRHLRPQNCGPRDVPKLFLGQAVALQLFLQPCVEVRIVHRDS